MSTIAEVIADGRRAILAHEDGMVRSLLNEYRVTWQRINRELVVLDQQIKAALARGEVVDDGWLSRQRWWRQVQWSIRQEANRFGDASIQHLVTAQRGSVAIASSMATGFRAAINTPFAGFVHAGAMEQWVSALQPNSPLRAVLDRYGTAEAELIQRRITEGLGSGQNSRNIVKTLMKELEDANEHRIRTLVRTETHRAYRGASATQFKPMEEKGIIVGYRWLCAKSTRSCIACIAMDGQAFDNYPMSQHPCCRCSVVPIASQAYVPGTPRQRESAADWFARQDKKTQQRMMPTKAHWDAYQRGMPLTSFLGTRHSGTWGDTVSIRPARALAAGGR